MHELKKMYAVLDKIVCQCIHVNVFSSSQTRLKYLREILSTHSLTCSASVGVCLVFPPFSSLLFLCKSLKECQTFMQQCSRLILREVKTLSVGRPTERLKYKYIKQQPSQGEYTCLPGGFFYCSEVAHLQLVKLNGVTVYFIYVSNSFGEIKIDTLLLIV